MADQISLELKGVEQLEKKMGTLFAAKKLREALRVTGETILAEVRPYPPETEANRPPYPYYERGKGTWLRQGVLRRTSETLSKRWRVKVNGAHSVTISNRASYAPFVHGHELQARFHKRRGWKRLKPTAEKLMPKIKRALTDQWRRIVNLD